MEISIYLLLLWRRKWIILTTVLMAMAVAFGGTYLITPQYESSVLLRLATATRGSPDWVDFDLQYADRMMNTYATIAASNRVHTEVMQRLFLSSRPSMDVEILPNTELIQITVQDSDPTRAALIANTYTDVLLEQIHLLSNVEQPGAEEWIQELRGYFLTARPTILEPATISTSPVSPNLRMNLMIGAFLGLLGGLGLALLLSQLDSTLYTSNEIGTATGLPILAQIPNVRKRTKGFSPDSEAYQEAYRRLRIYIFAQDRLQSLLITSALPGEGKTSVATQIAITVARTGQSVVIVDGNLAAPVLHTRFGLPNSHGLTNYLEKKDFLEQVIQKTPIPNLYAITSGPPMKNRELLESDRSKALFELLKKQFALVLVDSPALLATADASVLATMTSGVLMVVERGHARREALQEAQRCLSPFAARVIGVVVNRADSIDSVTYPNPAYFDDKLNSDSSTSKGRQKATSSVALEK
jgi:polysaccharide biosynthesis transport protein